MANWTINQIEQHIKNVLGESNLSFLNENAIRDIVSQEINFVEQYIGYSINELSIPGKYQPVIVDLCLSKVLTFKEFNQGGIGTVKLDGLSVGGDNSSIMSMSKSLREDALERLKELRRKIQYKRVIGG